MSLFIKTVYLLLHFGIHSDVRDKPFIFTGRVSLLVTFLPSSAYNRTITRVRIKKRENAALGMFYFLFIIVPVYFLCVNTVFVLFIISLTNPNKAL